ncbi:MAG: NUDIX hydrolase [Armatimonadetes bacterium]|nr:NUDIX hydrolase [Armatimonadota bacterium]
MGKPEPGMPLHPVDLSNQRYTLLAAGELPPQQVYLEHDPERQPHLAPWQKRAVKEHCRKLRLQGARLVDLPLYRFLGFSLGEELVLRTGATRYEEYLGCSLAYPEWAESWGFEATADALSIAGVTEAGGRLLVGRRSPEVAECPGFFHVKPAGHMHPPSTPMETVLQEAREELGLEPAELEELSCIGLVRSKSSRCVDVVFRLKSSAALEDLRGRRPIDAWEHDDLVGLEPERLGRWLVEEYPRTTDPGHASLVLEGLRRYGNDWLEQLWRQLP